ncbi:hypothetical protein [Solwaraspora sp. WMMD792]|uniref:hypothetical protein n=1 Tax=Solwaraspora sp. WMMD792 TaxID=3016099 RepID=UPI0024179873|nr:hypothetical protein [Solwaraspora sp. WMMD792]MDG4769973.1 hypothetical protein [Solwaraspora sp. WMMD792]
MWADVDLPGLHRADRADLGHHATTTGSAAVGPTRAAVAQPGRGAAPVTGLDDVLHVPVRPVWSCSGCGPRVDWPCGYARAELTANLDPISRSMYAAERMVEAIADLPAEATPGELFTRFLAWTRRAGR